MNFLRTLFLFLCVALCAPPQSCFANEPGGDICAISLESANNIYITHSQTVVGERYLTPLGDGKTSGFLSGNFDGSNNDGKEDVACVDISDDDTPYFFDVSSPGNVGVDTWSNSVGSNAQQIFYFLTGDFDGDSNDDVATLYKSSTGDNPDGDVGVKISYGPLGGAQLSDNEDWLLANEEYSAFVTGKFNGPADSNDAIDDIVAIAKTGDTYLANIYLGADGQKLASSWSVTAPYPGMLPVSFGACDFNGDHNDDIALVLYEPSGNRYYARIILGRLGQTKTQWSLGSRPYENFLFQDFNGDGYCDIGGVLTNAAGNKYTYISLGSASALTSKTTTWDLKPDVQITGIIAGDFGRLKSNISGRVYRYGGGSGLAGVTMNLRVKSTGELADTEQTNANGEYVFRDHVNDTYIVTAEKYGHVFDPSQRQVIVQDAFVSGIDFTSTNDPHVYKIKGRIYRQEIPSEGLRGMTLTITGGNQTSGTYTETVTTDNDGNYEVSVSLGNFTITPTNPFDDNFIFVPSSRDITVWLGDEEDQNFTDLGSDKCPYDSTKTDPGVCGCNISDQDTDDDGTHDCNDDCDEDTDKVVPGICGCGRKDVNVNNNSRCDWDEIADPNVPKYTLRGRVMTIDTAGNAVRGVGGILLHSHTGSAQTITLRQAYDIVEELHDGSKAEDLIGLFEMRNMLAADQPLWIDENEQGESNGAMRFFELNENASREHCPARTTVQKNSQGTPIYDENGFPQYITDAQRTAMGGLLCRYSPLRVNNDLTAIDFAVNDCLSGWKRDNNYNCVKLNLVAPSNLTATKGTHASYVKIEFDGSQGSTEYELLSLRDPEARFDESIHAGEHGTRLALISHFEGCDADRHCVYEDKSAIPGVSYRYQVRALNKYTTSSYSNYAIGWRRSGVDDDTSDSDGDGSIDDDERKDGTNPYDQGSFETRLRTPAYTKYNTFLGHLNYLELISSGTAIVKARISIYSNKGKRLGRTMNVTIRPNQQLDVDIHRLVGQKDTYGQVRIDFNQKDPGVILTGRMSIYRPDPNQDHLPLYDRTFSFAYASELRNPVRGSSFATANSIDPQGIGNQVHNWVEIANADSISRKFTVRIFNQNGRIVYDSDNAFNADGSPKPPISVPGHGEVDVQGGHELGEAMYLVQVEPKDGGANYFASVTRYGEIYEPGKPQSKFNFAIRIDAKSGNGDKQYVPISNFRGQCWTQSNWIEIINVSGNTVLARLKFRDKDGKQIAAQRIKLKPTAQIHVNTGALLPSNGYGVAEITPNRAGALIGQSTVYFHDCEDNSLQSGYSAPTYISGQETQIGSYNRYLDMSNFLRLMSTYGKSQKISMDVRTPKGSRSAIQAQTLKPYQTMYMDISTEPAFKTKSDTYGQMLFKTDKIRRLMVENLRVRQVNGRIDFAFPTAVR
ncbi:MAG: carboxypeptidase regulatory-like domain-containing protein [Deltaproteobacteria bacterium]|nr:carboxypeptidase regulatory-like domain-containing protein [Deltaproteobacteria bacterium]